MIYQKRWKIYAQWCRKNGYTVSKPSAVKVAHFLAYLDSHKHFSVSTIKGYRAVINSVYMWSDMNLNVHPLITNSIKALERSKPRTPRVPQWNLDVVLKYLNGSQFEPIHTASMRDLLKKTLFLLALATAKRVGELQALGREVHFTSAGDALFSYLPEFVAKTESQANPLPRHFRVEGLAKTVGRHDEERLLCPIRAIKEYLRRAKDNPARPRNLFASLVNNTKPLSKTALTHIRQ